MLKAVLFDLDNTLYAYEPCNVAGTKAAIQFVAKQLKLSVPKVQLAYNQARDQVHAQLPTQAAGHSRLLYWQICLEQLTGRTDVVLTQRAYAVFERAYLKSMHLRPGVADLLKALRRGGLKLGLVTDLTLSFQISKIQRLRLTNTFDILVTSEEVGIEKPAPQMVQQALRKLGLQKRDVVFVGDSLRRDQMVAQQMGIPFIRLATNQAVAKVLAQLL